MDFSEVWPEWKLIREIRRDSVSALYEAVHVDHESERCLIKVVGQEKSFWESLAITRDGMDSGRKTSDMENLSEVLADEFLNRAQKAMTFRDKSCFLRVEEVKKIPHSCGTESIVLLRMEYLPTLREFMCQHTLMERETLSIGYDLCMAVDLCTTSGISHGTIDPDNVFVYESPDGELHGKLGDFTEPGSIRWNNAWNVLKERICFPPEGNPPCFDEDDVRADLYEIGLVLYLCLNKGRIPFMPQDSAMLSVDEEKELTEATEKRMRGEPLPKPQYGRLTTARMILKACAYEKEERFQCPKDMMDAITEALDTLEKARQQRKSYSDALPGWGKAIIVLLVAGSLIMMGRMTWSAGLPELGRTLWEWQNTERQEKEEGVQTGTVKPTLHTATQTPSVQTTHYVTTASPSVSVHTPYRTETAGPTAAKTKPAVTESPKFAPDSVRTTHIWNNALTIEWDPFTARADMAYVMVQCMGKGQKLQIKEEKEKYVRFTGLWENTAYSITIQAYGPGNSWVSEPVTFIAQTDQTPEGYWRKTGERWWFSLDAGGYLRNTWEQIGDSWFYFDDAGYMATNRWVGDS